jgi:hypothetical protein
VVRGTPSGREDDVLPVHAARPPASPDDSDRDGRRGHDATAGLGGLDARVTLADEPPEIESRFRTLTRHRQPATKDWADSFLAAFATVGQLTLVTFDRGLRAKAISAILLG